MDNSTQKTSQFKTSKTIPWIIIFVSIAIIVFSIFWIIYVEDNSNTENTVFTATNNTSIHISDEQRQYYHQKYLEDHKQYIEEQKQTGLNNFIKIRQEYKSNKLAASDKYEGKTYTLCGEINAFNEDGLFNQLFNYIGVTITFKDNNYIVYTFCQFDISQRDTLMDYSVGDTILFSGKCYDWANWTDCKIIE